jgi:hypothetical protein
MAEILELDANGRNVAGARDDSSNEVLNLYADSTSKTLRVNCWVWNTTTLAWERMKQPVIELSGDLEVNLGDVERGVTNQYYKREKYFYSSGLPIYECKNTDVDANETDTDWLIWKMNWSGGNMTTREGPRTGRVDTQAQVAGLAWNI